MKHEGMQVSATSRSTLRTCGRAGTLLLALLLGACANPPPAEQAGVECVYVRVTGSNLPVKECSTPEQRAAIAAREREAADQGLRDLRNLEEFGVESAGAASLP